MTHQGYVPTPIRLAFYAALLSSSAIAAAQDVSETTPVPVPQEVPAPTPPIIPPDVRDEPVVAPAPSNSTDSIAPAARQAVEANETRPTTGARTVEPSRRVNPRMERATVTNEPATADEVSAPLPVAVDSADETIAADGTIAAVPVAAEPVVADPPVGDTDNSAENWLLALAGLGILGIAGGAGVAMTRRRKPVNAGAPIVTERVERPIANSSPVATRPTRIDPIEQNRAVPAAFAGRQPVPTPAVERTRSMPTPDIPIVDPLFAAKSELPPVTDPLFASHPDYVGNKAAFKGFEPGASANWSEPRRTEPAKPLDQPVN